MPSYDHHAIIMRNAGPTRFGGTADANANPPTALPDLTCGCSTLKDMEQFLLDAPLLYLQLSGFIGRSETCHSRRRRSAVPNRREQFGSRTGLVRLGVRPRDKTFKRQGAMCSLCLSLFVSLSLSLSLPLPLPLSLNSLCSFRLTPRLVLDMALPGIAEARASHACSSTLGFCNESAVGWSGRRLARSLGRLEPSLAVAPGFRTVELVRQSLQ